MNGATNIETLLEDRIRYLYNELEEESIGSNRYENLLIEIEKLYSLRNDEIKAHAEEMKVNDALEIEEKKLKAEKIWFIVGKAAEGFLLAVEIIFARHQTKTILKFEETGVVTSKTWNLPVPKIRIFKR